MNRLMISTAIANGRDGGRWIHNRWQLTSARVRTTASVGTLTLVALTTASGTSGNPDLWTILNDNAF